MTFASLAPLANRAAIYVALQQQALAVTTEALGEHDWAVDLNAGTLTFTSKANPEQKIVTRVHPIATIAPGPRSLLWWWANPQFAGEGLATRLRDYGQQYAIEALTSSEVPFPAETGDDLDAWITAAAHRIGEVAVEITGLAPYYTAPIGGGTRAVFVLESALPQPTLAHAVTQMPRLATTLELTDARSSLWDAARLAGWGLEWTDEACTGANVSDDSGRATFRFDEQARIVGVDAQLNAADTA